MSPKQSYKKQKQDQHIGTYLYINISHQNHHSIIFNVTTHKGILFIYFDQNNHCKGEGKSQTQSGNTRFPLYPPRVILYPLLNKRKTNEEKTGAPNTLVIIQDTFSSPKSLEKDWLHLSPISLPQTSFLSCSLFVSSFLKLSACLEFVLYLIANKYRRGSWDTSWREWFFKGTLTLFFN